MLRIDRDAVICDLAETYGIFNYRALPVRLLATLVVGLGEESRIKMRLSGGKVPRRDILLAAAVDRLSLIAWPLSDDGRTGANRPGSILNAILGISEDETNSDVETYDSPEDFEAEWYRRTGVRHGSE